MIHHTINTGHSRVSPREEVSAEAIDALNPLLTPGLHSLPGYFSSYDVRVTIAGRALLATVFASNRPCVTVGVAPDDEAADALWPHLERQYLEISEMPGIRSADFAAPHRPKSTPWCAAMTITPTLDEAKWLGDFERCLAWAWIERTKGD